MYAPDVVNLGGINMVLIGTGDREHPIAVSTASAPLQVDTTKPQAAIVKNRFYGIYDDYGVVPASPVDGTDKTACYTGTTFDVTKCDLVDVTDTTKTYAADLLLAKGWVLRLSTDGLSTTQEQVITTPATTGGAVYFSTFQPTNPAAAAQLCSNLGTARGYAVNVLTGGLRPGDTSRYSEFVGGGFAPSPVTGVVQLDNGKLVPFILGGKGTSPLEAGKPPLAVPGIRKQVYRFKKVDAK
jgi:type IV pilus assembly protein PilY1